MLGIKNVTFRYGSSNSNQQRVVLAGWRTRWYCCDAGLLIGQRCGFTVVIFAPHGITDGKCPEKLSQVRRLHFCGLDYPVYVLLL